MNSSWGSLTALQWITSKNSGKVTFVEAGCVCTAQNLKSGAKPDVRGEDSNTSRIIQQQTSLAEVISVET